MTAEARPRGPQPEERGRPRRRRSLGDALLTTAARLIVTKGPQGFTLREVARRAHVSEAAPYWHFADKEALLAAVAESGFRTLVGAMLQVHARITDPRDRLEALGLAYVQFAARHPSYLRVMFGPEVPDKSAHSSLRAAAEQAFGLLVAAVGDCQRANQVVPGDPVELAIAAWSAMHGLSALLVDGKIRAYAGSAREVERLARRMARTLIDGLAPRRRR